MLQLKDLIPHRVELDPEAHYRWQVWVGILMYLMLLSTAAIWTAMFVGLPKVGRLAWEDERNVVTERKIADAVKPIEQKITDLTVKVGEQNEVSKAFLAKLAEDNLLYTHSKMCQVKSFSTEWTRMSSDFERFRQSYREATGSEYRQLYCDERQRR